MRIAAHRGTRLHAPENTFAALVSGYCAGASVLELDLQLTKDGHLVLSHDGTVDRLTGTPGKIIDLTLADLRKLDFGKTFRPRNSPNFQYFHTATHRTPIEVFPDLLDRLPDDIELLVELKHDSSLATNRRDEFVTKAMDGILGRRVEGRVVLYSKDPDNLRLARRRSPEIRVAAFDFELPPDRQLDLLRTLGADGLVTDLDSVLDSTGQLTDFGRRLSAVHRERQLRVGAVLYPHRTPGVFREDEYRTLAHHPFVWSISTDSVPEVARLSRYTVPVMDEPFAGTAVDRERFAFGYAKANRFCEVTQKDGVRVKISKYDDPFPPPTTNPSELRLRSIENGLMFAAREWPYYSGGGVGTVQGIRGDFSAEVDYTVERVGQATTLEMAVVNVDPGAHRGKPPASFRDKDSFYDPHGAPPYVGVEHDEGDGYRINWNLGSEYDNNQYGRPVGDGKTPLAGRLRLDRRGPYFAAYYRNDVDAKDWVCVGVARNDSLNPVVYLRCVGKRWRQEKETNPAEFYPILANEFVFRNLLITRYVS